MSTLWESIEERERRVRSGRRTGIMARANEQVPEGRTLRDAFAQRPFISREDLRRITGRSNDQPVITLYLSFPPERLVRSDRPVFLSVFSSLRHQVLESQKPYLESLPHAQRLRVPEDLREVQEFLEAYEPKGARALLLVKSGEQLNRVMALPVRVADHLTIAADAYLQPLEAIMEEQHRTLVIDISKDLTRVSIDELGYEFEVGVTAEDVPRETHEAFREGKTERHRETHVLWHFKASAQLADRRFREAGCDLAIVVGEETTTKEFEEYLPKALRQKLVARLQLAPDVGANERRSAIEKVLNDERKREEEEALGELGFYQGHQRLATGLELVLNAADLFLMRQLFVRDDLDAAGFVCRAHHFLSLKSGSCPFDDQPLQQTANLLDELIEMARVHGVDVMLVSQRKDLLDGYQGIAAVLVAPTSIEQLRTVAVSS